MSSPTPAVAAIPFAPTAETLDAVIAVLGDDARRRAAFARYAELPAPGTKPGRTWKYDYDKLSFDELRWTSDRMTVATIPFGAPVADEPDVDRPALAIENVAGLVHVGGTLLQTADGVTSRDPRVIVQSLCDARAAHPDLVARAYGTAVDTENDRFAALSSAFANCGAFVYVPNGVVLDAPIQLVFANSEASAEAVFPHVVVVLGDGAKATVLERHVGESESFVCGIVEAHLGANAQLDYAAVQQAGDEARVVMNRGARCEHDATVRWHLAELGGALARSVVDANLAGEGAQAHISALFFNTATQHVDLTTTTEHVVGRTESDTVVRSAATDRGQGRYYGNIVIEPKAHGADASLRDDALLLSKRAHIDSVPALEIAANDVKAFHGATVGSLDADQLFYASTRGIAKADAMRMIALAFFEPAITRFPTEALRDEVRTALDRKIDEATEIDA